MKVTRIVVVVLATSLSLGLTSLLYANAAEEEAPDPTWLTTDSEGNYGRVDMNAVPETLDVLNCAGQVVGFVRSSEVFGLPTLTPEELAAKAKADKTLAAAVYSADTEEAIGKIGNKCVTFTAQ